MKIFRSVPQSAEQREFFGDYAKFSKGISWLILVAQIISGFTESIIFYTLGYDTFLFFGRNIAIFAACGSALLGVALIEWFGLRFMLPQCSRQFLYKRFSGSHLAMTIFITLVTALLIGASYYLSLDGGDQSVRTQLDKAENRQAEKIQVKQSESLEDVAILYQGDSLEVEQRYFALIKSSNEKHNANIEVTRNELAIWGSRKGNYQTRIGKARGKLKSAEAAKGRELADLELEKAREQKELRDNHRVAKDSLQAVFTMKLSSSESKYDAKESTFSKATFWAVLVAITLSIICIVIQSIYYKGSGQKDMPIPSDFDFRPSAMLEAWNAWTERIDTKLRNKITAYEANTPQTEISKRVNTVYDRNGLKELVVKLEIEQLDDLARTIQIAAPQLKDVPQRKIGFHNDNDGSAPANVSYNATVTDAAQEQTHDWTAKNCDNCGDSYKAKVVWQRFCKENCKLEWHSRKHGGKKFNPKLRGK